MYNRLWRAFIEGKLRSGTTLRQEIIGEVFGVSRAVVRKVLTVMEQEGFVVVPPNREAYVATPSLEDSHEVFEALRMTGAHLVAELAAPERRMGATHVQRLHQHAEVQRKAELEEDLAVQCILSSEFFMLLAHIHGNRIIAGNYENLMTRAIVIITHFQAIPADVKRSEFQKRLIKQIIEHDQPAAVSTFTEYHVAFERHLHIASTNEPQADLRTILAGLGSDAVLPNAC